MTEELFCRIYLAYRGNMKRLIAMTAELAAGIAEGSVVHAQWGKIDIVENDEYDKKSALRADDGFLFFRYLLETALSPSVKRENYVNGLRRLLAEFNAKGVRAVAACDFEDELSP